MQSTRWTQLSGGYYYYIHCRRSSIFPLEFPLSESTEMVHGLGMSNMSIYVLTSTMLVQLIGKG